MCPLQTKEQVEITKFKNPHNNNNNSSLLSKINHQEEIIGTLKWEMIFFQRKMLWM